MGAANQYRELEIRIQERDDDAYQVDMELDGSQQFGPVLLKADTLLPWTPGASAEDDGEQLRRWLFGDMELTEAWFAVRGSTIPVRIRLRLLANVNGAGDMDTAAPKLHDLPWEALQIVEKGVMRTLAADAATPFSRYLSANRKVAAAPFEPPLRIAVAVAAPEGLDDPRVQLAPIQVDDEISALKEALGTLDVELVPVRQPCTLDAIEEALRSGCHVLHFIGHGRYNPMSERTEFFMATVPDNRIEVVDGGALAEMFARNLSGESSRKRPLPRLIFLASCESAKQGQSPAAAFRGIAPLLTQAGFPAVVAMQEIVATTTARTFAQKFYAGIATHGIVDLAANEARSTLLNQKLPGAATPVIFMRLPDGRLFQEIEEGPQFQDFEPEMIRISAGEFVMGREEGEGVPAYETPAHPVTLEEYWIGKHPVTEQEYLTYIEKDDRSMPPALSATQDKEAETDQKRPVTGITWHEAREYCQWLNLRLDAVDSDHRYELPTEAEWEKAAGLHPEFTDRAYEWTISLWGPSRTKPHYCYSKTENPGNKEGTNVDANDRWRRVCRGGRAYCRRDQPLHTERGALYPDNPLRQPVQFRVVMKRSQ